MWYRLKLAILRNDFLHEWIRRWMNWRGITVGDYARIPEYIRQHAPSHSFADIGCMWGVNGEYSFIAAEAGATQVKAVDVFGPTPEFEAKHAERGERVEFILGDVSSPSTLERIGVMDVVFCAGVLYHHPSPFDLLVALRRICRKTLILRTASIPEVRSLRNAAIYYPYLPDKDRRIWGRPRPGASTKIGIDTPFDPAQGYGNFFWGFTPSCLVSLVETAGFRVDHRAHEAFAQTLICTPVEPPMQHEVPDEEESRRVAGEISAAEIAHPA
jgi:hypothetical protein